MERIEVTFPNGETHGYTFTEQRWHDYYVAIWESKGYKINLTPKKKSVTVSS